MRPFLEKLPWESGSSVCLLDRQLDEAIPFQWHHHPEYELTLTLNSRGQRFVGDHLDAYDDGDLVLVGPNLPHTWVSRDKVDAADPHIAKVIWFNPAVLINLLEGADELLPVARMLERGQFGLKFDSDASLRLRGAFDAMFSAPSSRRLLILLDMLQDLAEGQHIEQLANASADQTVAGDGRARIDRVLTHIHMHYNRKLTLLELADIAALSNSGLHRLFQKHMNMRIGDYIMRMRIGDACARLAGTDQAVGFIADEIGYASIANFNRQFKASKGMTPRAYRSAFGAKFSSERI